MSELNLQLPDDVMIRLQSEARDLDVPINDLVRAAIENYLNEDEPTKESILEDLRQAMREALAGEVLPARAVLAEVRRELGKNANDS